jgi:hypothetical protein
MSISSLQVSPSSGSVISIASRTDDGRDATSRPSGGGDGDGDASDGEVVDWQVVDGEVVPAAA